MATKRHCDACDAVIRQGEGGTITFVEGTPAGGAAQITVEYCRPHWASFKRLHGEWFKQEQGFVADLPKERTP